MSSSIELVRRAYEAYERRDFAAVFSLLDPAVEIWQTDPPHPDARPSGFRRLPDGEEGQLHHPLILTRTGP